MIDFGLGNAGSIQRVEVDWPSGLRQTFENVNAGHRYLLIENQNQPLSVGEIWWIGLRPECLTRIR